MKNLVILLTIALFLSACTTSNNYEVSSSDFSCPEQYLQMGMGCCLDVDSNNVCDADDVHLDDLDERALEKTAKDVARFIEKKDPHKLYTLLPDNKKQMLTQEEFAKRYHQVYPGSFMDSIAYHTLRVDGDKGYVTYFVTLSQEFEKRISQTHYFVKTNSGWKYDDLDNVFYAYCQEDKEGADCGGILLGDECEQACLQTGYTFKEKQGYACKGSVCQCPCGSIPESEKRVVTRYGQLYASPVWNSIH